MFAVDFSVIIAQYTFFNSILDKVKSGELPTVEERALEPPIVQKNELITEISLVQIQHNFMQDFISKNIRKSINSTSSTVNQNDRDCEHVQNNNNIANPRTVLDSNITPIMREFQHNIDNSIFNMSDDIAEVLTAMASVIDQKMNWWDRDWLHNKYFF
jgi:hypothetical protein